MPASNSFPRIILLAVALTGLPAAARAQLLPGSVQIGGGGGRFYGGSFAKGSTDEFSGRVLVDDDKLNGFWVSAVFRSNWAFEVAVRRSTLDVVSPQGGVFPEEATLGTLDFATIDLSAVRYFPIGNFAPFLGAGAGVANLDINVPDRARRDVNRPDMTLAVGAEFFATKWIGVRIDYRARATYLGARSVDDGGFFDSGRWFRNQEVFGGVFFAFGTGR